MKVILRARECHGHYSAKDIKYISSLGSLSTLFAEGLKTSASNLCDTITLIDHFLDYNYYFCYHHHRRHHGSFLLTTLVTYRISHSSILHTPQSFPALLTPFLST